MWICDIKVGDILHFGKYDWFKADEHGAFVSVNGIGRYPYGYRCRENDETVYVSVLNEWLNSTAEEFDLTEHHALGYSGVRAFRQHRSGFLGEFESEELDALDGAVSMMRNIDVCGDNKLPLFGKMGIRIKNEYGRYEPYWLERTTDTYGVPCVGRDGQIQTVWGCASLIPVRLIIHIDQNLTVERCADVTTVYSRKPKKAYEINFNSDRIETMTYTEEDFASLFELA